MISEEKNEKNKWLLIIEDEKHNNRSLEDCIKREKKNGWIYDWTTSGNEAYEMLAKKAYDLIFLDIMVPHGEGNNIPKDVMHRQMGLYLLELIRKGAFEEKGGVRRDTKVILVTGILNAEDMKNIRALINPENGEYFQKPVSPSKIIEKAAKLMANNNIL